MARRVLRVASIGVAGGAGFGVAFGAWYMLNAIESWIGPPPRMAGLLAGWAVIVWLVSVLVAGFAIWSWRAPFKTAAIGMTIAGAIAGYWAIIYFGHDQAMFVACAVVTMIVLGSTAAAVVLSARRAGALETSPADSLIDRLLETCPRACAIGADPTQNSLPSG